MGGSGSHKRVPVVWLASILLVAAIADVGAVRNTKDPKAIVKDGIDAAVQSVGNVLKNTELFHKAEKDPSTKAALDVCNRVLETAVNDLKRSIDKVENFHVTLAKYHLEDLKSWLSAVTTYQENCLDAFDNTTNSETAKKVKDLMVTARKLTIHILGMTKDVTQFLKTLGINDVGDLKSVYEKGKEGIQEFFAKRKLIDASVKPNVVVAQDGSGQFKTIGEAVATVPPKNTAPFIIYVKAGTYKEYVSIPTATQHVTLIGDGPTQTRISGDKNFAAGVKTIDTCTLCVDGPDFMAKDIGIENTAGAIGHQAVALRSKSERSLFHNVNIDGYQDSLYTHAYQQFYSECSISGTIDFVFGNAKAFFQNCNFIVRKPMDNQGCMVTAQGRVAPDDTFGAIIIQNGTVSATDDFVATQPPIKAYLGRPWKEYSRTIYMQSFIGGFIDPLGWSEWQGNFALDTLYYAEYDNRGPGSNTTGRVTWKGIQNFNPQMAEQFTAGAIFTPDDWIKSSGFPYVPGMMQISK